MRHYSVDLFAKLGLTLGEGPHVDPLTGSLSVVDILESKIVVLDPVSGTVNRTIRTPGHIGSAIPATSGGWLLCDQPGVSLLANDGVVTRLAEMNPPQLRMNDAKIAPDGSLWVGSMAYDSRPGAASLYRVDRTGTVTTLLSHQTISNGMDWSDDGRTFFYIDSAEPRIQAFTVTEDQQLTDRHVVTEVATGDPDGMTMDAEGCLWVALWEGYAVHRYSPSGELIGVVALPIPRPTSCVFGGPTLSTLFITSARDGLTDDQLARYPLSGGVFSVASGVTGRPARGWRG